MALLGSRCTSLAGGVLLLSIFGCTGGVGRAIEPKAGTASDALGESCRVGERDTPLVIDWKPHERSDLEEAMSDGVAVVRYECGALRVLQGCRLDGAYRFLAASRKEQVLKLEDKGDIALNLPAFGKVLAGQLSASLEKQASLDLAMVIVGKARTTVTEARKELLRGGDACAGATHFVRGAFVGAFALATGTRGSASTVAVVVEANSKSSTLAAYRDGDVQACTGAREGDARAPTGCSALVRLELVALGGASAEGEATCPNGFVRTDGKCTKAGGDTAPRLCRKGDAADCAARCEKGHLRSCDRLGHMHLDGEGAEKDLTQGVALFTRACDAGLAEACGSLAYAVGQGIGVAQDKARAAELYRRACDAAEPHALSCVNLAIMLRWGTGVVKDEARAAAIYRKACDGGEARACLGLGMFYAEGTGFPKDELRAAALFKQSCDGGFAMGCYNLGQNYEHGQGVASDIERAIELYKKGCAGKHEDSCTSLDYFRVKH
jgi:hypothetical protein